MRGLRYFDIDELPRDIGEDNRQLITAMKRNAPKPTYILMVHPYQWRITEKALDSLSELIPDEHIKELALLKGTLYEKDSAFKIAIEERIGQKSRAKYEHILLEHCLHHLSGQLVPAEVPPLSTNPLELIIGSVQHMSSQIMARNSNACQCWREYALLEEQKMDLIEIFGTGGTSYRSGKLLIEQGSRLLSAAQRMTDIPDAAAKLVAEASKLIAQGNELASHAPQEATAAGNLSKTAFEKKISDIDRILKTRWKGEAPVRYAENIDQPPCEHCGKYRQLDETLTFATPDFIHQMINIALGGEMPLISVLPFLESLFSQIYNPDMIPEAKKKDMTKFVEKIQLQKILDILTERILRVLGIQPEQFRTSNSSGDTILNMNQDSTDTSPTTGDSPRMLLTSDSLQDYETGSMTNTVKENGSDEMN